MTMDSRLEYRMRQSTSGSQMSPTKDSSSYGANNATYSHPYATAGGTSSSQSTTTAGGGGNLHHTHHRYTHYGLYQPPYKDHFLALLFTVDGKTYLQNVPLYLGFFPHSGGSHSSAETPFLAPPTLPNSASVAAASARSTVALEDPTGRKLSRYEISEFPPPHFFIVYTQDDIGDIVEIFMRFHWTIRQTATSQNFDDIFPYRLY